MTNTNFRFLEAEWQELFRFALKAEGMSASEPDVSTLFCRITLEKAIYTIITLELKKIFAFGRNII